MFFVHVLKNLRDRAAERELIELVSGMTDGQVEDLGFGGLRDARRQAATEQRAAAAGWGPWYLR